MTSRSALLPNQPGPAQAASTSLALNIWLASSRAPHLYLSLPQLVTLLGTALLTSIYSLIPSHGESHECILIKQMCAPKPNTTKQKPPWETKLAVLRHFQHLPRSPLLLQDRAGASGKVTWSSPRGRGLAASLSLRITSTATCM